MQIPSVDELWQTSPATNRAFSPDTVAHLPEPARRYLNHAIQPGAPLASTVRLTQHGQIKLKDWCDFTAQQVNRIDGKLVWAGTVKQRGISITGSDCLYGGEAAMKWSAFGFIPVTKADGPDVTRSMVGRYQAEAIWLPTLLVNDEVTWDSNGENKATAHIATVGFKASLSMQIRADGGLEQVSFMRWGNPAGEDFMYEDFGAIVEAERTFGEYTLPSKLRVGWYFGTRKFESDGEFFRVNVDRAEFR